MTPAGPGGGFLGLKHPSRRRSFRAAVIGPPGRFFEAVVAASAFVELYDEELEYEPYRRGIATERVPASGLSRRLRALEAEGVFPCLIGYSAFPKVPEEGDGRRTILFAPAPGGAGPGYGDCDLVVGHRAGRLPRGEGPPKIVTAREISAGRSGKLPPSVPCRGGLLVIDPLVLDPSLLPVRGNLEPGGLQWYPLTALLRDLLAGGKVAAALILPCALPRRSDGTSFLLARLAAKVVACVLAEG